MIFAGRFGKLDVPKYFDPTPGKDALANRVR